MSHLRTTPPSYADTRENGPSLLLHGLRKAFADVVAVDGLDLEVPPGECFGLLGPNGAGKTTTIEICEGLTAPDAGTVKLLGIEWHTGAAELRQRIGIQLQETQFPDKLTVEETLRLFRSFYHHGLSVEESIRTAQLEEKRTSRVGTLSGGQKQRLAMACALVGDPELLFLDEPTTGLDPQVRLEIHALFEELRGEKRTILMTTHYIEEAERLCDRVAIVDSGKVIAIGTPRELQSQSANKSTIEIVCDQSLEGLDLPAWPFATHTLLGDDKRHLTITSEKPAKTLVEIVKWVDAQSLGLEDVHLSRPTLEDVFIELTGKRLRD